MFFEQGKKYLVTTDDWFFGPDGNSYKACFGTFKEIMGDDCIGIKTNRGSSNWYAVVGCQVIAGCQIHNVIRCDDYSKMAPILDGEPGNITPFDSASSRIFNADSVAWLEEVK